MQNSCSDDDDDVDYFIIILKFYANSSADFMLSHRTLTWSIFLQILCKLMQINANLYVI